MSYTIINPATEEAMEVIEHASLEPMKRSRAQKLHRKNGRH
jgi:hypothetical protein